MKKISLLISIVLMLSLVLASPAMASSLEELCFVDIGDDDGGHNLDGWGPVEPGMYWIGSWGGVNLRVVWDPEDDPEDSRCATLTLDRHINPGLAKAIQFRYLEGLNYDGSEADESFDVYVKSAGTTDWGTPVFQYVDTYTGAPKWTTSPEIDITGAITDETANVDVRICATGDSIWDYFYSHWGQVGFDWIRLLGCDTPNGGGEGLTPGYWKNHLDDWVPTGYGPDDSFNDIFGVVTDPALTLDEAVNKKGNSINSLIRHAVAALLNANHPNIDYDLTEAEVIAIVQEGFATGNYKDAKNILEPFNEQGGDIDS
jgi:hypothetical protein